MLSFISWVSLERETKMKMVELLPLKVPIYYKIYGYNSKGEDSSNNCILTHKWDFFFTEMNLLFVKERICFLEVNYLLCLCKKKGPDFII